MRHNPFTALSAVVTSLINAEVARSGEDITATERDDRAVVIDDVLRTEAVERGFDPEALHGGQVGDLLDFWHAHVNAELTADEGEVEVVEGEVVDERVEELIALWEGDDSVIVNHDWFVFAKEGSIQDSETKFAVVGDGTLEIDADPNKTLLVIAIEPSGKTFVGGSNRIAQTEEVAANLVQALESVANEYKSALASVAFGDLFERLGDLVEELVESYDPDKA